jgi:hypothetical protein
LRFIGSAPLSDHDFNGINVIFAGAEVWITLVDVTLEFSGISKLLGSKIDSNKEVVERIWSSENHASESIQKLKLVFSQAINSLSKREVDHECHHRNDFTNQSIGVISYILNNFRLCST